MTEQKGTEQKKTRDLEFAPSGCFYPARLFYHPVGERPPSKLHLSVLAFVEEMARQSYRDGAVVGTAREIADPVKCSKACRIKTDVSFGINMLIYDVSFVIITPCG